MPSLIKSEEKPEPLWLGLEVNPTAPPGAVLRFKPGTRRLGPRRHPNTRRTRNRPVRASVCVLAGVHAASSPPNGISSTTSIFRFPPRVGAGGVVT